MVRAQLPQKQHDEARDSVQLAEYAGVSTVFRGADVQGRAGDALNPSAALNASDTMAHRVALRVRLMVVCHHQHAFNWAAEYVSTPADDTDPACSASYAVCSFATLLEGVSCALTMRHQQFV